jgi:hypothetical protein
MALFGRDANGTDAYIQASGVGTSTSPYVTYHDAYTNDLKFKAQNLSASADVLTAVSGKKLRVMSLVISTSAAGSIKFQSDAATDVSGNIYIPANGTVSIANPLGLFQSASTGDKINAVVTWTATAGTIGLTLGYREV